MERVEGARTPYEVYCFRCRVTFPIGSRRCLHCGGPLFAAGERTAVGAPIAPAAGPAAPDADADDGAIAVARRFGGLAVWALVALAAVLQSLCRGAGSG